MRAFRNSHYLPWFLRFRTGLRPALGCDLLFLGRLPVLWAGRKILDGPTAGHPKIGGSWTEATGWSRGKLQSNFSTDPATPPAVYTVSKTGRDDPRLRGGLFSGAFRVGMKRSGCRPLDRRTDGLWRTAPCTWVRLRPHGDGLAAETIPVGQRNAELGFNSAVSAWCHGMQCLFKRH